MASKNLYVLAAFSATLILAAFCAIYAYAPCPWVTNSAENLLPEDEECPYTLLMMETESAKSRQIANFTQVNTSVYRDSSGSYLFYCPDLGQWGVVTDTTLYLWRGDSDDQLQCPPAGARKWSKLKRYKHATASCASQKEWNTGKRVTITLKEETSQQDQSLNYYQMIALACLIAQSAKYILSVSHKASTGVTSRKFVSPANVKRAMSVLEYMKGHIITKVLHNGFYSLYVLGLFVTTKCVRSKSATKCAAQEQTLRLLTIPFTITICVVPILWLAFWFRVKSWGCQCFENPELLPEKGSTTSPLTQELLADEAAADAERDLLIQIRKKESELEEAMAMRKVNERLQTMYKAGMALCRSCMFLNLLSGCSVLFAFQQVSVIKDAFSAYCSPISPLIFIEMLLSMVWLAIPLLLDFLEGFFPLIYVVSVRLYRAAEFVTRLIWRCLYAVFHPCFRCCCNCLSKICRGLLAAWSGFCRCLAEVLAAFARCQCSLGLSECCNHMAECHQSVKHGIFGVTADCGNCLQELHCPKFGGAVHCPKFGRGMHCPKCEGDHLRSAFRKCCACLQVVCAAFGACLIAIPGAVVAVAGAIASCVGAIISFPLACLLSICSPTIRGHLCTCLQATPGVLIAGIQMLPKCGLLLAQAVYSIIKMLAQAVYSIIKMLGLILIGLATCMENFVVASCSLLFSCCSWLFMKIYACSSARWQRFRSAVLQLKPRLWIEVEPVSKTYGCGFSHTREVILEGLENGSIGFGPCDEVKAELDALKATLEKQRLEQRVQIWTANVKAAAHPAPTEAIGLSKAPEAPVAAPAEESGAARESTVEAASEFTVGAKAMCNGKCTVHITSHRNQQLQDDGGWVGMSQNKLACEQWTITQVGNGKVFITSHRNQQLQDSGWTVRMSQNKRVWEQWTITQIGNGKVLITSHRNQQLQDNGGKVGMSRNKLGWEGWIITALSGENLEHCFQAHAPSLPAASRPASPLETRPSAEAGTYQRFLRGFCSCQRRRAESDSTDQPANQPISGLARRPA